MDGYQNRLEQPFGGGIAWQKSQADYKNTPANAPAAILAARLYQAFGDPQDLEWAHALYNWQQSRLVDPDTGFVWDGMNRTGDGRIDKDWKYTYNQGVYIGAAIELYRVTGSRDYLEEARRTFAAAVKELAGPHSGILPDEGGGDAGLFKGILVRYAAELAQAVPEDGAAAAFLRSNAEMLWDQGKPADRVLFGPDWTAVPSGVVQLSTQLSGLKLLERMAVLARTGQPKTRTSF